MSLSSVIRSLPWKIPDRKSYISLRRPSSDAPGAYRSRKFRNLAVDPGPRWLISDSMADTSAPNDSDIEIVHCRDDISSQ
jgi:hypothetical protein